MILYWCLLAAYATAVSKWVYFDAHHHLQYRADERGNRIMDFSHAGYRGGGVRIPETPVVTTLAPLAEDADNTPQIQAAIDALSKQSSGAILLAPGTYNVAGTIAITASGVVLRGSG